jgi:small redox-active disulfide protein 2
MTKEIPMEIKILGGGCPKCKRLEQLTREVVDELSIEAAFGHVKQMSEIMAYDVLSTPALVIDEEVKASGRIPRKDEIKRWVMDAQA